VSVRGFRNVMCTSVPASRSVVWRTSVRTDISHGKISWGWGERPAAPATRWTTSPTGIALTCICNHSPPTREKKGNRTSEQRKTRPTMRGRRETRKGRFPPTCARAALNSTRGALNRNHSLPLDFSPYRLDFSCRVWGSRLMGRDAGAQRAPYQWQ